MSDCVFCKIAKKEIQTELYYEDDTVIAFNDMYPQAKVHILVIPKKHFNNINEIDDANIFSSIFLTIQKLTKSLGIDKTGFRIITNLGPDACQSVFHVHFHILAGQKLPAKMS